MRNRHIWISGLAMKIKKKFKKKTFQKYFLLIRIQKTYFFFCNLWVSKNINFPRFQKGCPAYNVNTFVKTISDFLTCRYTSYRSLVCIYKYQLWNGETWIAVVFSHSYYIYIYIYIYTQIFQKYWCQFVIW